MSLIVEVKGTEECIASITRLRDAVRFKLPDEILDGGAEIMRKHIREGAPKGMTGALADSTKIEKEPPDKRTVAVTAPYARAVNKGTRPSPGRYVPALGKRLVGNFKIGWHPGVKGTHFFDNAIITATPLVVGYFHRRVYEYLGTL